MSNSRFPQRRVNHGVQATPAIIAIMPLVMNNAVWSKNRNTRSSPTRTKYFR